MVVKLVSPCTISVTKLEEILQQAKRFNCSSVSLVSDSQLRVAGIIIASSLNDNDVVFTIETSGTKFFENYVDPYLTTKVRRYSIDPKTGNIQISDEPITSTSRVIIIDDVIDSGETMKKSISILSKYVPVDDIEYVIYCVVSTNKNVDLDIGRKTTMRTFIVNDNNTYAIFPWEL